MLHVCVCSRVCSHRKYSRFRSRVCWARRQFLGRIHDPSDLTRARAHCCSAHARATTTRRSEPLGVPLPIRWQRRRRWPPPHRKYPFFSVVSPLLLHFDIILLYYLRNGLFPPTIRVYNVCRLQQSSFCRQRQRIQFEALKMVKKNIYFLLLTVTSPQDRLGTWRLRNGSSQYITVRVLSVYFAAIILYIRSRESVYIHLTIYLYTAIYLNRGCESIIPVHTFAVNVVSTLLDVRLVVVSLEGLRFLHTISPSRERRVLFGFTCNCIMIDIRLVTDVLHGVLIGSSCNHTSIYIWNISTLPVVGYRLSDDINLPIRKYSA